MARILFDTGIFSVLDVDAEIGIGWQLAFYTGGTTTPITTYNARTGGSANANPVISDADGRFPQIWIADTQTIKWVLSDDSGVPKRTQDNVAIAAPPPTVASGLTSFLAGSSPLPIANGGTNATSGVNALDNIGGLAKAGGTVSGNITRQSGGAHAYWAATQMTTPKMYITSSAAADPRAGKPGEVWFKHT